MQLAYYDITGSWSFPSTSSSRHCLCVNRVVPDACRSRASGVVFKASWRNNHELIWANTLSPCRQTPRSAPQRTHRGLIQLAAVDWDSAARADCWWVERGRATSRREDAHTEVPTDRKLFNLNLNCYSISGWTANPVPSPWRRRQEPLET